MLLPLTIAFDFCASGVSLWLAFYLLGRGFPSRLTLRALIVLLALSGFFLSAFFNIFHQVAGTASLRAALLVIVLATWYSLTAQLLPQALRTKRQAESAGVYFAAVLVVIILLTVPGAFVAEIGNGLWVARMGLNPPFILYGLFQVIASAAILSNLLSGPKIGLSPQGRSFFVASLLSVGAVGYGVIALAFPAPLPRLIQDMLIFSGVFLMGYSVARYQTLVERRTILQDLPFSGLVVLGVSVVYVLLAKRLGYPPESLALVLVLAIVTHSAIDLTREFLERQRYRHDSAIRHQLRRLENPNNTPDALEKSLQEGLALLCQAADASGGWIAVQQADAYLVSASHNALPTGSRFVMKTSGQEDLFQPADPELANTAWIAPAYVFDDQVVLLGISPPRTRLSYSQDDLDLLAEVADRLATIISLFNLHPGEREQISQLVFDAQPDASDLRSNTDALRAALVSDLPQEFTGLVEDALRHLSDYIVLGQLPLADRAGITGANHIERGRNLQQLLVQSIEMLHPAGKRPPEPLPREWYNYVILYDAYVECVPNREIMARLYISEGTFNRTRRNALRGLARLLWEMK